MDQIERLYSSQSGPDRWEHGNVPPGTFTTMETPATGHFAEGSPIPPGRFCAISPSSMTQTTRAFTSTILPDRVGTHLRQTDGSDYTGIIANALNAASNLEIIGVSVDYSCAADCEAHWGTYPCPPVGYLDEAMRWKFFKPARKNVRGADAVSLVQNDNVTVYCEQDMAPGDPLFIRHTEVVAFDPNNLAPVFELLGGVTNVADAGTMPITDTKFANARVVHSANAGSSVWLYLG